MTGPTERKVDLLLDSGAFSSWTQPEQPSIKVKDYIKFVQEHRELLWACINLDVIPGNFGQKRTPDDVAKAASGSYKNLQAMKDAGLEPMAVFHFGESFKWLDKLLADGEKYIGFGGLVDIKDGARRRWLDQCFSMITDTKGRALVKTHGFGITSVALMMRYPWYSVDSTAWVKVGGFGAIWMPVYVDDKPDYHRLPARVHISGVMRDAGGEGFASFGPHVRGSVKKWLTDSGFSLGEIRHSRARRCANTLAYFNGLIRHLPKPFKHRHNGFAEAVALTDRKPIRPDFHLFHSTNISNDQGSLLTEANCRHRLLSYFELRGLPPERIAEYVTHGMTPGFVRRQPKQKWSDRGYLAYRYMELERHWRAYRDEEV